MMRFCTAAPRTLWVLSATKTPTSTSTSCRSCVQHIKDNLARALPPCDSQAVSPGPLSSGRTPGKNRFGYRYTRASWTLGQRLVQVPRVDVAAMASIKGFDPLIVRAASPAPLAQDFARQQVSKQQRSNFHSSSLKNISPLSKKMPSVNKTSLHPTGVQ
jgi:hypothetical protein